MHQFESMTTEQNINHGSSEKCEDEPVINEEIAKRRILDASLPLVHQHGWTWQTIAAGAESIGYPAVAHGMFPKGAVELIHHFNVSCNRKLVSELESRTKERKMRLMNSLQTSLEMRLRMIIPYIDTWPKAMAILTLPSNIPQSTTNLSRLIDDIWYYSGDRTANFDWYTKRLALASLYWATELAMIQDKSDDFDNTWVFLARRIHELEQVENISNGIPNFVQGIATTFKNVIGLGGFKR